MERIIGYQIESTDGLHNIPTEFFSFEVFPKTDVDRWLSENNQSGNWKSIPITKEMVEEPTLSKIYR